MALDDKLAKLSSDGRVSSNKVISVGKMLGAADFVVGVEVKKVV